MESDLTEIYSKNFYHHYISETWSFTILHVVSHDPYL